MKKHSSCPRLLLATLAFAGLHASSQAAGVTHTTTTASGNFSAATFTQPLPSAAGDTVNYNGTAAGTLALDQAVTTGLFENTNTGAFTLAAGAGTLTLDNTGGPNNPFNTANAFLGTTTSGTLTVAAPVVLSNTDLGIGAVAGGAVTLSGALTATTAQSLFYRANGTGVVTDSGPIGATGSALTISNAGTGTGAVNLTGAIGGATGTGAAITISNVSTGTGGFALVSGTTLLGASVSSITQNSATSILVINGANNAAGGFAAAGSTGTVAVTLGTLRLGNSNALGAVNAVTVTGGTFDVFGNTDTIGNLSDGGVSTGTITNTVGSKVLTLGGATSNFSGTITNGAGTGVALALATSGTGTVTLSGTNTYIGTTQVGTGATNGSTLIGTNRQAFGSPTTNALNQLSIANAASTLRLLNDGGTGTVTGQTIIYGGATGSASATGYNLTAPSGTINVGSNGNAGSTGNTIQLGQLTQSSSGTLNFTSANGYGINFAGGLNSNLGTATQVINTTATPVSFANIVGTGSGGRSLTVLGTGTVTDNGSVTATGGTAFAVNVGATTSGGITGNLVLAGTGSTVTGGSTVNGGSLTLVNADSLGSANPIVLQQANATTLTTATLNLRNNADTTYGNNVTAISGTPVISVDIASAVPTAGEPSSVNRTLTLGTLNAGSASTTTQGVTFTNGAAAGYSLAFGAATSAGTVTFTNNMVGGTTTLASFTDSAASAQTLTFNGTSVVQSGGNSSQTVVTGAIAQNGANALSVRQTGTGTLVFNGTNTYTGTTTVSAGALLVNGANNGAGAVTVSGTGTTLGGSGSIAGATTIGSGAILAPGPDSFDFGRTGLMSFGSTLALNGTYLVNLHGLGSNGSAGAAGNNYDQIVTTGALTLSNTTSLLAIGNDAPGNLMVGQVYPIALNGGTNTLTAFSNVAQGGTVMDSNGDTFTVSYTANFDGGAVANDISLTVASVAAVPEPTTMFGGVLLLGALGFSRRRQVGRWLGARRA